MEGSKVLREFRITDGRIQTGGVRSKPEIAVYTYADNGKRIYVMSMKTGQEGNIADFPVP